jgi:hypothetical protein
MLKSHLYLPLPGIIYYTANALWELHAQRLTTLLQAPGTTIIALCTTCATCVDGFLLAGESNRGRLAADHGWTIERCRGISTPLYRLRSALSSLWLAYPPTDFSLPAKIRARLLRHRGEEEIDG